MISLAYVINYFYRCKDNANERNESLLSNCRVQLIFCKDNANERNVSCLQIAECSLSSAKINRKLETTKCFWIFRHVMIEKYYELVVSGHELVEMSLPK